MTAPVAPYAPWSNRRIGIEMELNASSTLNTPITRELLAAGITNAFRSVPSGIGGPRAVRVRGYTHNDGSVWEVKTDGSCGYEVTTPAITLDADGHNPLLRAACDAIESFNPSVDRRCGLHVHVDVSDFTWEDLQRLLTLWLRYEPFFFECLPSSRRGNSFCRATRAGTTWGATPVPIWLDVVQATSLSAFNDRLRDAVNVTGRYMSLNLTHWWMTKRVEFRLGAGTVNYTRVRRWAMMLLALVGRVKATEFPVVKRIGRGTQFGGRVAYTTYIMGMLGVGPYATSASRSLIGRISDENRALYKWVADERARFTPDAPRHFRATAPAATPTPTPTAS